MSRRWLLGCLPVVVLVSAVGCGGAGSGAPDGEANEAAIRDGVDHPDGTFDATSAAAALYAVSYDGPTQEVVRTYATTCAAANGQPSGSCPCPAGGSFDFTNDSTGAEDDKDTKLSVQLHACAMKMGAVDGHEYLHTHIRLVAPGRADVTRVGDVGVTVTDAKGSHPLELRTVVETHGAVAGDYERFSTRVADGWLTVGPAPDGGRTLTDRHGSFVCSRGGAGAYSCVGPDGQTSSVTAGP